jgi:RNA polymerase sigma-70 factor (ECF subfamily)
MSDGEWDLVRRAQAGDDAAFEALVERYQSGVETVALAWVEGEADAEDIVQETFLKAYTALVGLREPEAFGSWVMSIARNVARNLGKRSRAHREVALEVVSDWVDCRPAPQETEDRLGGAMEALDPLTKQVLLMHHYDDLPVKEIARVLALPDGTVKRKLFEARGRLRAILGLAGTKVEMAPAARATRRRIMEEAPIVKLLRLIMVCACQYDAKHVKAQREGEGIRFWFGIGGEDKEIDAPPARLGDALEELIETMVRKSPIPVQYTRNPDDAKVCREATVRKEGPAFFITFGPEKVATDPAGPEGAGKLPQVPLGPSRKKETPDRGEA